MCTVNNKYYYYYCLTVPVLQAKVFEQWFLLWANLGRRVISFYTFICFFISDLDIFILDLIVSEHYSDVRIVESKICETHS